MQYLWIASGERNSLESSIQVLGMQNLSSLGTVGFNMEVYFYCLCFCTFPQPAFWFLAVHTLHHPSLPLCHPRKDKALLYSSHILAVCIRAATMLKKINASGGHIPNFITSRIPYKKVKQGRTVHNTEGSIVSAFMLL